MAGSFLSEDLQGLFDADEFADVATFDGSSDEVIGILDKAFDLASLGGADIGSTGPAFTLASADVPANCQGRYLRFGDLLAGGARYRVAAHHPDGQGMSVLVLQDA